MAATFGNQLRFTEFGESHGPAVGCVLEGVPAGVRLDMAAITAFLKRRAPGQSPLVTARSEADAPEFLSGIVNEVTTGAPIAAIIRNRDQHSSDYGDLKNTPRPGHADFTAYVKYRGFNDIRGGGQFSGRLTAPLCLAGAVARQLLAARGVFLGAHIAEIGGVTDERFTLGSLTADTFDQLESQPLPLLNPAAEEPVTKCILQARQEGDSVGGVVECAAIGLPAGIGEPPFDGLENRLAQALFAIPAVKGVEFGDGFDAARSRGSLNNDAFCFDAAGEVRTQSNHAGGILGGISNGMPVVFRTAFKPTPSIAIEQDTVNLRTKQPAKLRISGRHDPCIVPRALPAVIAAAALVLADMMLSR